jgi:PKD repeat protein
MQISRGVLLGIGAVAALGLAFAIAGSATAAVNNGSRIDAGPLIEARVNEGFDVTPAYYEDPPVVEAREIWWDLDNRTDAVPHDGNPTNDKDQFNVTFHYAGFDRVGDYAFTLWINYSDGQLLNGTRLIHVVENQPPVIDPVAVTPTGVVGDPIGFTVVVHDNDSIESRLLYKWDFDVGTDSDLDGDPANDVDSTATSNVTHVYNAEGTYTAKLTVTDDYGASTSAYINVIVLRPPGVCQREVKADKVGQYYTEPVTIRKLCYASYAIKVTSGRLYQYTVTVANNISVYVMVQTSLEQYGTYTTKSSQTPYRAEWSKADAAVLSITVQFRPDYDGTAYVTIDNGFLLHLDPGKESEMTVTIEDVDRSNILANIPIYVWIVAGALIAGVAGFFVVRGYMAGAAVRSAEKQKHAVAVQEKMSAKSELDQFLSNPDAVIERKMAPPPPVMLVPPPGAPLAQRPGPPPVARGPPRPAGPQAPQGYVPPPPPPPPPPPQYPQQPTTGPKPAPAYSPQAPQAPALAACPNCGSPIEAGWQLCPNCGNNL